MFSLWKHHKLFCRLQWIWKAPSSQFNLLLCEKERRVNLSLSGLLLHTGPIHRWDWLVWMSDRRINRDDLRIPDDFGRGGGGHSYNLLGSRWCFPFEKFLSQNKGGLVIVSAPSLLLLFFFLKSTFNNSCSLINNLEPILNHINWMLFAELIGFEFCEFKQEPCTL